MVLMLQYPVSFFGHSEDGNFESAAGSLSVNVTPCYDVLSFLKDRLSLYISVTAGDLFL